jgi:hypothetical protein
MVSVEEAEMKGNSSLYTLTIWLVSKLWKVHSRRSAGLIAGFATLQGIRVRYNKYILNKNINTTCKVPCFMS